jgi:hypothetical protein
MVFEPPEVQHLIRDANGTKLSISSSKEVTEVQCLIRSEGDLLKLIF